jgi:hypothetical protein
MTLLCQAGFDDEADPYSLPCDRNQKNAFRIGDIPNQAIPYFHSHGSTPLMRKWFQNGRLQVLDV